MSHKQIPRVQFVGIHKAPTELTYAQQPQTDVETVIERTPASQYLVLDSKNRYFTATPNEVITQPWNNFRLQKGESLMQSFATRLTVSEIRFPWFIPNITRLNNKLWFLNNNEDYEIELTIGFTSPADIVTEINQQFTDLQVPNKPILSYRNGQYTFTKNPNAGNQYFSFFNPLNATLNNIENSEYQYTTQPSLMATLGFTFAQSSPLQEFNGVIKGNVTESLYTSYIDIISNKLNQFTTNLDGSSDITSNRLLLRLYISDEISIFSNYENQSIYAPFLIHRQFKNPKEVMWNKESVVDWLDISVRDQYGQLVPLPEIATGDILNVVDGAYPDFQITLLASEN
jgi:hypothetical protein